MDNFLQVRQEYLPLSIDGEVVGEVRLWEIVIVVEAIFEDVTLPN